MDETTKTTTLASTTEKERFGFIKHFPQNHPRATAILASIGVVTVATTGVAVVKGLKKTDVTVTVGDDVVLDTASTTETA